MSFNSITYFQNLKQFFMQRGKKSRIENLMYSFLLNRAKLNKGGINAMLEACILNSTPNVRLKIKRRGKKVKYKIGFIEKEKAERKALGFLSKNFKEQSIDKFALGLEKELDLLSLGKSSITIKRNEMHKQALLNMPFRWKKSIKKQAYFKKIT